MAISDLQAVRAGVDMLAGFQSGGEMIAHMGLIVGSMCEVLERQEKTINDQAAELARLRKYIDRVSEARPLEVK